VRRLAVTIACALLLGIASGAVPADASAHHPVVVDLGTGPVMPGPIAVHVIFWESHAVDAPFDSYMLKFLSDLHKGGSALLNSLSIYQGPGVAGGPVAGPPGSIASVTSWSDRSTPLPSGKVDSSSVYKSVAREVLHAITYNKWPTGVGNAFLVYTGPGYESGATNYACAWHFDEKTSTGDVVPYAFVPRPGVPGCIARLPSGYINPTPSGSVRQDGAISLTWHELAETLTDPIPFSGYTSSSGEIADPCTHSFPGYSKAHQYDEVLNGHNYLIQGIWNVHAGGCTLTGLAPVITSAWNAFGFGQSPSTATTFSVVAGRGGSTLEVTDVLCRGDRFEIWDNGIDLGATSYVDNSGCSGTSVSDPSAAFADPTYSTGTYFLPSGTNQISIQVIQNAATTASGSAYYRNT